MILFVFVLDIINVLYSEFILYIFGFIWFIILLLNKMLLNVVI